jgi:beta-glucanase (GH16 family)
MFCETLEPRRMLAAATSTVLLRDEFNGSGVNGQLWHIPQWNPDGSTFLGRTQLRTSENEPPPKVSKGAVHLTLDSYNRTLSPGQPSFYGTELISNKTFRVKAGAGLDMTFRARFNAPISGGIVGGLFAYKVKPDGVNHDEMDTELLSNEVAHGNRVETNVYANEPLGAGTPIFSTLPLGGKLIGYHTYRMVWYPGRSVSWYVDGRLIRTEKNKVPAGPVQIHMDIWASDSSWPAAFNGGIQPTSDPGKNRRWSMDVDSVIVKSVKPAI